MMLKKNQGFTLIELVIGMAILAFILGGIVEVFQVSNSVYQSTNNQAKSIPNVNLALSLITGELSFSTINSISTDTKTINYTYSGQSRSIGFNSITKAIDFKQSGTTTNTIGSSIVQNLTFSQTSSTIQVTITYNASGKSADAISITSDIMNNGI